MKPPILTSIPHQSPLELIEYYDEFASYYPDCEMGTKAWFVRHVAEDWVIFDCGANIGYFSLLFARLASKGQVYAFEPTRTFEMLQANLAHHRVQNVVPLRLALGKQSGQHVDALYRIWGNDPEEQTYAFTTVDDFVSARQLDRLDCIKIDVDSFDFEVLQGAQQTLLKFDPFVMVELNHALSRRKQSNTQALEWMAGLGYTESLVLDYDNFLFKRSVRSRRTLAYERQITISFDQPEPESAVADQTHKEANSRASSVTSSGSVKTLRQVNFPDFLPDIPVVGVADLHRHLGFPTAIQYPQSSLEKPLTDWLMETDDSPIFRYLYRHLRPRRHLEFGTWQGTGTLYCLEECEANVWTINLPFGENFLDASPAYRVLSTNDPAVRAWVEKLGFPQGSYRSDGFGLIGRFYLEKSLGHRVCQIYGDSRQWDISNYPPGFFDTVLIDGGHTAEIVISDTQKAMKLVKPGGVVLWHDFCPEVYGQCGSTRGVLQAVSQAWDWLSAETSHLFWIYPSWILLGIKKGSSFGSTSRDLPTHRTINSNPSSTVLPEYPEVGSGIEVSSSTQPEDKQVRLSIVVTARNDNHGANMLHRFQVFINGLAAQCRRYNLNAELLVVEWNPPAHEKRLAEVIEWPEPLAPLTVRFFEVPLEIHQRISNSDKIPLFQMIGKNVGIRRAKGEFVLASNIDILFSDELMSFLAGGSLKPDCFYRVDRYDVGSNMIPSNLPHEQRLEFCRVNVVRIQGLYGTQPVTRHSIAKGLANFLSLSEEQFNRSLYSSEEKRLHTAACGDFTLMARKHWLSLKGYPELPKWSIYVDGLLLHMARAEGLRQVILPDPMRIYHIEHDLGWAVTQDPVQERPSLDYEKEYLPWCEQMLRERRSLNRNDDQWGLAQCELKEYVIQDSADRSLPPETAQSKPANEDTRLTHTFRDWISKMAAAESRLYYRDQTPESLRALVNLVHRFKPTKIVELGTLAGLSLRTWLATETEAEIVAIDLSFNTLRHSQKLIPMDLSRVKLIENDILRIDLRQLWKPHDRILLYVDAHDQIGVPIMEHLIENAFPALPQGSIVAVDDLWYSPLDLSKHNGLSFFESTVINEIDSLQCFDGYYAPYWKGGSFFGFLEVIPLLEWVNRHRIELAFKPDVKSVSFEWPPTTAGATDPSFESEKFEELTGKVSYTPVKMPAGRPAPTARHEVLAICNKGSHLFQTGHLVEAKQCFEQVSRLDPQMSGAFYAQAVILGRMGQLKTAATLLNQELKHSNPHPKARPLLQDIETRLNSWYKPQSRGLSVDVPAGVTLFAMPKPFHGHIGVIQCNALKSWTLLKPRPEIILFGNEHGTAEIARELGLRHLAGVKRNEVGTPLVNSLFTRAQRIAKNDVLAYVNADIILMNDFLPAIQKGRSQFEKFLMIGQRWDLGIDSPMNFDRVDWQDQLRQRALNSGSLHPATGIDYFVFTRGLWPEIPEFAIGRTAWDNWLVAEALRLEHPVVDATQAAMVIHQNHDYSHIAPTKDEAWRSPEVNRNRQLAGPCVQNGFASHATWELTPSGLIPRGIDQSARREGDFFQAAYAQEQGFNLDKKEDSSLASQSLQGFRHFEKGHWTEALERFNKLAQQEPKRQGIHLVRGQCLYHLNRWQEAEQALLGELAIQPNHPDAQRLLQEIKSRQSAKDDHSWVRNDQPSSTKFVGVERNISVSTVPEKAHISEETFPRFHSKKRESKDYSLSDPRPLSGPSNDLCEKSRPLRFLQIHTYYEAYLHHFYSRNPHLALEPFDQQIRGLVRDGFCAVHMFAPYMQEAGYQAQLIIANCRQAQLQWAQQLGFTSDPSQSLMDILRKQIETFNPEVLYLTDPVTFDSRFVRSLQKRPDLVLGWRAADIPSGTDWSEFDVILSGLTALRDMALQLGAKSAEPFFPGFPPWMNQLVSDVRPEFDVVFSGQVTSSQHPRRNFYLQEVAKASFEPGHEFSLAYYLSGQQNAMTPEIRRFNLGSRYGIDMYRALRSGRIALDARGNIGIKNASARSETNLALNETANMRILEVTGCGVFLLTEYFENLKRYFELGREIETFQGEKELLDKIRYYVAHPEEREAVARRGEERCRREHSMQNRAKALDRIIRKQLSEKRSKALAGAEVTTVSPRANDPKDSDSIHLLIDEAAKALQAGNAHTAFGLLIKAKAQKQPTRGLDCLRAICFLKMNQVDDARETLREELRYFPDNPDAKRLFDELSTKQPQVEFCSVGDSDFEQLYRVIRPYTMLSELRLFSLFSHAKEVCLKNQPGNFVECGVAAGGSTALLAYVLKRYSRHPRRMYSFDSFSGMPEPTAEDQHHGKAANLTGWGTGTCSAPEESVKEICRKLGVLDVVTTVKGYFQDTLPKMRDKVGMISLLHLDGDWYESTRTILEHLYDRVVPDGFLQVDDYGHWEGCRKAIHEFMEARKLQFSLEPIDATGVWFLKPDKFPRNPYFAPSLVHEFSADDPVAHDIESQMSPNERFQMYYALRKLLPRKVAPLRCVEIGSYAGGSLFLICQTLKRLGLDFHVFAVEPGGQPQLQQVSQQLNGQITHLKMISHQAAPQLLRFFEQDRNLSEFILVDGDHSYEGVRQDILNYYPLLAPGGIMMFHDYLPPLDERNQEAILAHHGGKEPGIRRACQELMEETYHCKSLNIPLLYPTDPTQTQPHLQIIPGVFSTLRAYRKTKPVQPRGVSQIIRVLQVADHQLIGGAAVAGHRLFQGLKQRGVDVRLAPFVTPTQPEENCKDWQQWFKDTQRNALPAVASNTLEHPPGWPEVVSAVLEKENPEIINIHNVHEAIHYRNLPFEVLEAMASKAILVLTLHDMWYFTGRCAYNGDCTRFSECSCDETCPTTHDYPRLEPQSVAQLFHLKKNFFRRHPEIVIVTPSRWLAQEAQKSMLSTHRIEIIPHGIDLSVFCPDLSRADFRRQLGIHDEEFALLAMAADLSDPRKGLKLLWEALSKIQQKIVLLLVGKAGVVPSLPQNVRIISFGFVHHTPDMVRCYSAADLLVSSTLEDNLPNVLIESIACGTPCLGFKVGGVPEVIRPGLTGWLGSGVSSELLAQSVINILQQRDEASFLRNSCRQIAESDYALDLQAARYEKLYRDLVAGRAVWKPTKSSVSRPSTLFTAVPNLEPARNTSSADAVSNIGRQSLLGFQNLEKGNWSEALACFDNVLNQEAQKQGINFLRGKCLYEMGCYEESRRALQAELTLKPDHPDALQLLWQLPSPQLEVSSGRMALEEMITVSSGTNNLRDSNRGGTPLPASCRASKPEILQIKYRRATLSKDSSRPESQTHIRVSAIVSTYNSERFIQGCLEDLTSQTLFKRGELEIVVVNSCSRQGEESIVQEFRKRFSNIKCVRSEQRETIYQAWNRGIKAASGGYLTNANTDDRHRGDALELMAKELDAHPDVALVYGDVFVTNFENQTFSSHVRCGYHMRPDFSREIMLSGCHMGPQPMWRRGLHDEIGYFRDDLKSAADYEFWCRIALKYPMSHIPQFLGLYFENPAGFVNQDRSLSYRETEAVKRVYATQLPEPVGSYINNYQYTKEAQSGRYVNICMVTFNRLAFTKQAIESVVKYTCFPHVLTVVDNHSQDGTQVYLRELKRAGVIKNLVLLCENIGIANASNLAWSQEPNAQYYLKYDNDIVMQKPDWLLNMVEIIDGIPELGALGYNFEQDSYPVQAVRGYRIRVKVGNLGGACYLIPKRTEERLGYWCEDYGLYGEEDSDHSVRLRLAGFINAYMEDENIGCHLPGGRAGEIDPLSLRADDDVELKLHFDYRLWKDHLRRKLQSRGGVFARNWNAYHQGKKSLYVPRGTFLGTLGSDIQVFERQDSLIFMPLSGMLRPEHRRQVTLWAQIQDPTGSTPEVLGENGKILLGIKKTASPSSHSTPGPKTCSNLDILGVPLDAALPSQPHLAGIIRRVKRYIDESKLGLASKIVEKELGHLQEYREILSRIHQSGGTMSPEAPTTSRVSSKHEIAGISLGSALLARPDLAEVIQRVNRYLDAGKTGLALKIVQKELGQLPEAEQILSKLQNENQRVSISV